MTLEQWLKENDMRLYLERVKVGSARKQCTESIGCEITAQAFREIRADACNFWMNSRRRRMHPSGMLSERQWLAVKRAVEELKPIICGLSIDEAVDIVRSRVTCSRRVLMGLPGRLHVWK